ncbi:hypothetical protein AQ619_16895 [Caulobacter henricii]|uniref:Sulfatase-modifying factor enzyme-like domain-containing protein n=1 Tax=Caulobacter henricii TaxID=69395 RepID=A0A0P0P2V9_9CAUL|nr:hypothetical protein AQ619_16895 [Caulobacter henricii]
MYFDTKPGDVLTVGFAGGRSVISIVSALGCPLTGTEARSDFIAGEMFATPGTKKAKETYIAGGGRYIIRVGAIYPTPSTQYIVQVIRAPGKKGIQLAPGAVIQAVDLNNTDTASTAASPQAASYAAGQTVQDCPNCPSMIVVPAGTFLMGSTAAEEGRGRDEGPRHPVTFANPFAVGRTEISFDEWNACVADNGCTQKPADGGWGQGKQPVINVTWNDAMGYAAWLSKKTGQKYFLPSESEWEYAARAGGETAWNTGEAIVTDDANFLSVVGQPVPVASYPANAFGLHDLHGNVAEWVRDCHKAIGYFGAPNNGGIADEANCAARVQRGGDWTSEPAAIRSARRAPAAPLTRGTTVGFRVARAL